MGFTPPEHACLCSTVTLSEPAPHHPTPPRPAIRTPFLNPSLCPSSCFGFLLSTYPHSTQCLLLAHVFTVLLSPLERGKMRAGAFCFLLTATSLLRLQCSRKAAQQAFVTRGLVGTS